jgi:phospholipid/cholesterol/gamma-HCH transport system permease protein
MTLLAGKTVSSAVRPPYPYGGELISQFLLSLRLVWFPLLVTTVAICYRAPGLQASNFLVLFGALDRLGGVFVLAAIREIGPLITSIVVAGVAGTAITADLGARKVREELDTNVLDAHDLTIATGAIEWIVEVSGPSSSGRR